MTRRSEVHSQLVIGSFGGDITELWPGLSPTSIASHPTVWWLYGDLFAWLWMRISLEQSQQHITTYE